MKPTPLVLLFLLLALSSAKSQAVMTDSSTLFQMSRLLTILGNYEAALECQTNLLQNHKNKDISNDAGVNAVLAALEYFEPREMPYILPVELDVRSRPVGAKCTVSDRQEKRKALLLTALQQFEQVLTLDENYVTGYLHKGCVLALLGAYEDARVCLQKGRSRCSTQKMATDFLAMEGISYALQGDKKSASGLLEQAKTIGSYRATLNYDILQNKPAPAPPAPNPPNTLGMEQIDWYRLADFVSNPAFDRKIMLADSSYCGVEQRQQSRAYLYNDPVRNQYVVVQETMPNYQGATRRAITLKSSGDNVQEAYGVPAQTLALPEGIVWVYPEAKIFFRFNTRAALQSWGVYLTSGE